MSSSPTWLVAPIQWKLRYRYSCSILYLRSHARPNVHDLTCEQAAAKNQPINRWLEFFVSGRQLFDRSVTMCLPAAGGDQSGTSRSLAAWLLLQTPGSSLQVWTDTADVARASWPRGSSDTRYVYMVCVKSWIVQVKLNLRPHESRTDLPVSISDPDATALLHACAANLGQKLRFTWSGADAVKTPVPQPIWIQR
jgi:hypothetical protein